MSKKDEETFAVELPMRLYDYQDLIIPLLDAVARRAKSRSPHVGEDPASLLAAEIVHLLGKQGTEAKNRSPHGLVVLVIHLVKHGHRDAAKQAIEAACADQDLSRRFRAFFASLPAGERPEPLERWPERLQELLENPRYATLGPKAASRIASSAYSTNFFERLKTQVSKRVDAGQLPRSALVLLGSLIVLSFSGGVATAGVLESARGRLGGDGHGARATGTASQGAPSSASAILLGTALLATSLGCALWYFLRDPTLADSVDEQERRVDAGGAALTDRGELLTPSTVGCPGTEKEQKQCYLARARELRASDLAGSRSAYERSLAFNYEPTDENREDTLSALLELSSLEAMHNRMPAALAAYRRYLSARPRPRTNGDDCAMLFALASRVVSDEAGLAEASECERSGLRPGDNPVWGSTRTFAPTCHSEQRRGLTLERLARDGEAFELYVGALEYMLNKGIEHLAAEHSEVVGAGWGNAGCETPDLLWLLSRAREVGDRLRMNGNLVWFENEALAAVSSMKAFRFALVAMAPSDYGCVDDGTPLSWQSYAVAINGSSRPPGNRGLLLVPENLRVGANEVVVEIRFGVPGQVRPAGCSDAVRTYRFCVSATYKISPLDRCTAHSP